MTDLNYFLYVSLFILAIFIEFKNNKSIFSFNSILLMKLYLKINFKSIINLAVNFFLILIILFSSGFIQIRENSYLDEQISDKFYPNGHLTVEKNLELVNNDSSYLKVLSKEKINFNSDYINKFYSRQESLFFTVLSYSLSFNSSTLNGRLLLIFFNTHLENMIWNESIPLDINNNAYSLPINWKAGNYTLFSFSNSFQNNISILPIDSFFYNSTLHLPCTPLNNTNGTNLYKIIEYLPLNNSESLFMPHQILFMSYDFFDKLMSNVPMLAFTKSISIQINLWLKNDFELLKSKFDEKTFLNELNSQSNTAIFLRRSLITINLQELKTTEEKFNILNFCVFIILIFFLFNKFLTFYKNYLKFKNNIFKNFQEQGFNTRYFESTVNFFDIILIFILPTLIIFLTLVVLNLIKYNLIYFVKFVSIFFCMVIIIYIFHRNENEPLLRDKLSLKLNNNYILLLFLIIFLSILYVNNEFYALIMKLNLGAYYFTIIILLLSFVSIVYADNILKLFFIIITFLTHNKMHQFQMKRLIFFSNHYGTFIIQFILIFSLIISTISTENNLISNISDSSKINIGGDINISNIDPKTFPIDKYISQKNEFNGKISFMSFPSSSKIKSLDVFYQILAISKSDLKQNLNKFTGIDLSRNQLSDFLDKNSSVLVFGNNFDKIKDLKTIQLYSNGFGQNFYDVPIDILTTTNHFPGQGVFNRQSENSINLIFDIQYLESYINENSFAIDFSLSFLVNDESHLTNIKNKILDNELPFNEGMIIQTKFSTYEITSLTNLNYILIDFLEVAKFLMVLTFLIVIPYNFNLFLEFKRKEKEYFDYSINDLNTKIKKALFYDYFLMFFLFFILTPTLVFYVDFLFFQILFLNVFVFNLNFQNSIIPLSILLVFILIPIISHFWVYRKNITCLRRFND